MKTIMNNAILILLFISFSRLNSQTLSSITSWAYQLQNINIDEISNSSELDLVVIDYSEDGSEEGKFTWEEIRRIKESDKKVISYLSIGEAESYRYYWNDDWDMNNDGVPDSEAPSWLGNENPDWQGNYKVKFWDTEWQNIIYGYIDKIIEQGFDGIYCDIIDAYYYWSEETGEMPGADTLMMSFIVSLREYVNQKAEGEFYIIPQNGEYIIEEINVTEYYRTHYLNSINAIGVEDVFCYGEEDENNPFNPDTDRIRVLNEYRDWGIAVLAVEYLTDRNLIDQFVEAANQNSFIPYATVRALDYFTGPPTAIDTESVNPVDFTLYQNYPNPFNPLTTIEYELPAEGTVTIKVFDVLGKEISTLVNEIKSSGMHKVTFNAVSGSRQIANGIYVYRIDIKSLNTGYENHSSVKKMLLIK